MPETNNANGAGGTPLIVSPDGRWVAAAQLVAANGGAYLLGLDQVSPQVILEGNVVWLPFWAPDNRRIAFFEEGQLKVSDITGAPPENVSDAPEPVGGGTWSPDGVIVFSSDGVLYRVPAAGGAPQPITSLDPERGETAHVAPHFLPDGRHFMYLSVAGEESAVYLASLDSPETTRLVTSTSAAVYAAPGYLLFNRQNAVFAQPFDPETLELGGEAIRIVDADSWIPPGTTPIAPSLSTNMANFSASQTGVLAYRKATAAAATAADPAGPSMLLTWYDRSGNVETVGPQGTYAGVDLAPDDTMFAVHRHEGDGGDNWFFDGRMQRLTFDLSQHNASPVWSRDGSLIAFTSQRDGQWGIYVKASDGTGTEDLIVESERPKAPISWSADDTLLVYWQTGAATSGDVWMVPVEGEAGDRSPVALLETPANERFPIVSPDGNWLAYVSNQDGSDQVYIRPFPEGPGNISQVSTEGGNYPRWRGDGQELYFVSAAGGVMGAEIRVTGSSILPGEPRFLFGLRGNPNINHAPLQPYHRYAVTSDGERFLVPQPSGTPTAGAGNLAGTVAAVADDSVGGATGEPGAVNIILNWTRLLDAQ